MTLPSPNLAPLTAADARITIANAIDALLSNTISLAQLAQWALKAYHSRVTDGADDLEDAFADEDDEDEIVVPADEQLIVDALDALMFADDPTFALDGATLISWRNRLRIAVV
ncbi:MAG: hypothetical protein RL076_1884 [Chloroflexota bacterium]|jgi:hypothetical protein